MKSIDSLRPKSQTFLSTVSLNPLLAHYKDVLPTGNIENEIETFKSYLHRNPLPPDSDQLHDVLESISNSSKMPFDFHDNWNIHCYC